MVFTFSKYLFLPTDLQAFKICKLVRCYKLNRILIKHDKRWYLTQFVSEMFYSLQWASTRCAPQYKLSVLLLF